MSNYENRMMTLIQSIKGNSLSNQMAIPSTKLFPWERLSTENRVF